MIKIEPSIHSTFIQEKVDKKPDKKLINRVFSVYSSQKVSVL